MADINDERSIAGAISGSAAVVNAVSLYVEQRHETFHSVHVAAAARLARLSRDAGVGHLILVSGIGAGAGTASPYIRSRGKGERAVRKERPDATLVRPAVMFGPDDAFLNTILDLLRRLPVYPMFGRGETRLQPVHVEDVAEAIVRVLARHDLRGSTVECGGPQVFSYRELLETVARAAGLQPRLVPVPFAAWHALAWLAEALPTPALTRNQVELMEVDTVVSQGPLKLQDLDIQPRGLEPTVQEIARSNVTA
jgi:uncharacterized protein YbjT (DUF2867 family)